MKYIKVIKCGQCIFPEKKHLTNTTMENVKSTIQIYRSNIDARVDVEHWHGPRCVDSGVSLCLQLLRTVAQGCSLKSAEPKKK